MTAPPAAPSPTQPISSPDALSEYQARLAARRAAEADRSRVADRIGNIRLLVFFLGAVVAYFAIWPRLISLWWLVIPTAVFLYLLVYHEQTLRARDRARRAAEFYEQGLRRLQDTWQGTGNPGARFADAAHPYAPDLDMFGRSSLFELLCIARTRPGEERLASWLQTPAPSPQEIGERQQAAAELRPHLNLREEVAVLGEEVRTGKGMPARSVGVQGDALITWGEAPPSLPPDTRALRAVAAVLSLAAAICGVLWMLGYSSIPFGVAVIVGQLFAWRIGKEINAAQAGVERAARDLELLAGLLARIEAELFQTPRLAAVQNALGKSEGASASRAIAQLGRLLELVEAPRNPFFAPVALVLLWRIHCGFLVEAWRRQYGSRIRGWLVATGDFEALSCLAGYAYEHPADTFPTITAPGDGPPCFEAEGMAHPLLPASTAVPNDVALGGERYPRLLLVSGSNMSGKSTLLRAIGVNTVLALAGAPVRATRLKVSPVAIGASLRTQDSLQGGVSRFMAEIRRLRQVAQMGEQGDLPLLFLLDEILSGTNSHDRRIGAEALTRALLTRGRRDAIGLITTHDLALTEIATRAPELRAENVHLEDQIEADVIAFDYRLRPGVVTKSNALALMRAVGLDV